MRLSIHTKLFLTLLLACVLVLLGTQAFVQWSFRRGLVELADAREQGRVEQIADRLIDIYRRDQSWRPLLEDHRLWVAALRGRGQSRRDQHPAGQRPEHRPPWLHRYRGEPAKWPPRATFSQSRARKRPLPLELRLMLLNADGSILYGRKSLMADTRRHPLVLEGKPIGELALIPGPPIPATAELRFRSSQAERLWIIAVAMLLLSAALAYPLSRRLVRPVRGFQEAARRLACGDYGARVPIQGSDEIARLGRDINALAAALERNEQTRRRWVADISHELRTPIALLRGELEALQDGVRPLDRTALDRLHDDVLRLARLVNDLYELSITDTGALGFRFADTDVAELLVADIEAFRKEFLAAGLDLHYHSSLPRPVILHADAQRLSQLFRNLIRNSLQYTNAGGHLSVELNRAQDMLCIDFRDTAPGVPAEAIPRLFERLYRVDASRSRHTGGAGLGLAIAQNIVAAHGGTIAAAPSPSGGLWICIRFPI